MDVVLLSRLQFAVATYFHFLFVPLTLGLSLLLAVMETIYVRTGNETYKSMTRFWGKLFIINFAVGVVTGITLEFQFGTNWSRYSRYVGDIFGPLLAIEATVSFFLESTFIAVWALGWDRLSPRLHCLSIWLVAAASSLSAVWILIANAWMQHPVGYVMQNGRPVLSDFLAVVAQPLALLTIAHVLAAAYVVAGFFVLGISAYQLLRNFHADLFEKSFRLALGFTLFSCLFVVVEGHMHGADLAHSQPAKLAALESHWVTQERAPIYLLAVPNQDKGGNSVELGRLPAALSILAFHRPGARVTGLRDFPPDERPPVLATFVSFRLMVTFGMAMVLLLVVVWFRRKTIRSDRLLLRSLMWAIPVPYLTCLIGWTVAEVGRQPWIVYGLMRTGQAASPVSPVQVLVSLVAFIVIYAMIGITAFWLMAAAVRKGPDQGQPGQVTKGVANA
ncbi:MAG TPA: cytochrome ubiquinol oxidase subunit I [Deltaproteobacteria bacterium]|nr:cytochrome ubiquinol oxidase subunit I [Deltaproteobacteria bacterium]